MVLVDTSADEDVNINEKLLNLLPESFTRPQLPQVSHDLVNVRPALLQVSRTLLKVSRE